MLEFASVPLHWLLTWLNCVATCVSLTWIWGISAWRTVPTTAKARERSVRSVIACTAGGHSLVRVLPNRTKLARGGCIGVGSRGTGRAWRRIAERNIAIAALRTRAAASIRVSSCAANIARSGSVGFRVWASWTLCAIDGAAPRVCAWVALLDWVRHLVEEIAGRDDGAMWGAVDGRESSERAQLARRGIRTTWIGTQGTELALGRIYLETAGRTTVALLAANCRNSAGIAVKAPI